MNQEQMQNAVYARFMIIALSGLVAQKDLSPEEMVVRAQAIATEAANSMIRILGIENAFAAFCGIPK